MNIRFLETFVWLAKLRSFRLTAERLNSTQAAVSSRIAALEQEFGVRLFDRGSRDVSLTQAGSKALGYAERILRLTHEMRSDIFDRKNIGGVLRIGVIDSVVHSWLSTLIKLVRQEFPRVTIELTCDTTINLSSHLSNGNVDIVLHADAMPGGDIANVQLGSFPMRWVGSPDLGISGDSLSESELANFPIVSFARNSVPHQYLQGIFSEFPGDAVQINCVTSAAAIVRLIVDGFGIGIVAPALVREELATGKLTLLKVTRAVPELRLVASYRRCAESELWETIVRLAQEVVLDFSLLHGPEYALLPNLVSTNPLISARNQKDASEG